MRGAELLSRVFSRAQVVELQPVDDQPANDCPQNIGVIADIQPHAHANTLKKIRELAGENVNIRQDGDLIVSSLTEDNAQHGVKIVGAFSPASVLVRPANSEARIQIRGRVRHGLPADLLIYVGAHNGQVFVNATGEDNILVLGSNSGSKMIQYVAGGRTRIVVGDRSTMRNAKIAARDSEVTIGRDCMISSDVEIYSSDQHGLVDIDETGGHLVERSNKCSIGDHVWLGRGSRVIGNAKIGSGSILGAFAVHAGKLAANCAAVGNPARVVRENVTWTRDHDSIDKHTTAYIRSLTAPAQISEQHGGRQRPDKEGS